MEKKLEKVSALIITELVILNEMKDLELYTKSLIRLNIQDPSFTSLTQDDTLFYEEASSQLKSGSSDFLA